MWLHWRLTFAVSTRQLNTTYEPTLLNPLVEPTTTQSSILADLAQHARNCSESSCVLSSSWMGEGRREESDTARGRDDVLFPPPSTCSVCQYGGDNVVLLLGDTADASSAVVEGGAGCTKELSAWCSGSMHGSIVAHGGVDGLARNQLISGMLECWNGLDFVRVGSVG